MRSWCFAAALGTDPPDYVVVAPQARRARVLELHAAALVAVLGWIAAPGVEVRVELAGVLGQLLGHEERFWLGSARALGLLDGPTGMTPALLRQTVAAACLLGAANQREAVALLSWVPETPPSVKVATWLHELYPSDPGSGEWLGTLQPDRLAERLVVNQLGKSRPLAQACLTGLGERQARRAVLLLARAATEDDIAEQLLVRLLPLVSHVAEEVDAPLETLESIANAIPYPSVVLAAAHAAITRRILEKQPATGHPTERARWLMARGNALIQLGRFADAFSFTQEAADIYRGLVAARPGRYKPDLADSLLNLGVIFSGLGRPADALHAEDEAVGIRRELADADPDRYRPDLAESLSNLGPTLTDLSRYADALLATQEAAGIYRGLAAAKADLYRPDLARTLSGLGVIFSGLGRSAETLRAEEEAVSIYRELADTNPGRYRPGLADSLSSLGATLSGLGLPADALRVEQEAVSIRRELADADPERYRPDLALSLFNLGVIFSELIRPEDALRAEQEAVSIYRDLVDAHPTVTGPALPTHYPISHQRWLNWGSTQQLLKLGATRAGSSLTN